MAAPTDVQEILDVTSAVTAASADSAGRILLVTATGSSDQNITQAEFQKLINLDDLRTAIGILEGATNMGAFTGSTLGATETVKSALQDLSDAIETVEATLDGLSVPDVTELTGDVAQHQTLFGVPDESTTLGTFTGSTLSDNTETVKTALQKLVTALEAISVPDVSGITTDVTNLQTLSGVGDGSTNLGAFSGGILGATETIKTALQDLSNAIEAVSVPSLTPLTTDITNLQTLSGQPDGSTHLGTFTGSTIQDNRTTKQALQDLETAHETVAATASGNETDIGTLQVDVAGNASDIGNLQTLTGRPDGSTNLGAFTGTLLGDTETVKSALQDIETAHETLAGTVASQGTSLTGALTDVTNLQLLSGMADGSQHLGDLGGAIIRDNPSVLQALQDLQSALEGQQLFGITPTTYTEVEAGLLPDAESAGVQTTRTSAIAAFIAGQGLLTATKRLPAGLYACNGEIVVPRQGTMVGQGRYKTVFSLFDYAAGRFIVSYDFDAMQAANFKFNEHVIGQDHILTLVTNGIELRDFGIIGRADNSISDRPLNSTSGNKGDAYMVQGIKLWGGGQRLENLVIHQVPGAAIYLEKGGLARAGNTQFLDDQFTICRDLYIQCCLSGLEWHSDADGRMHDINVHSCRDYGVNLMAHGAVNVARVHSWGNCIGQNYGNTQVDMHNLSDLYGDNDMCGIRTAGWQSNIVNAKLLNCKQVGLEAVSYGSYASCSYRVAKPDWTGAAYDPDYRPWPVLPYMALYTSAPNMSTGAGGTEVAGGGYVRRVAPFWEVVEGTDEITISRERSFGLASAAWGTVTHYGLWDSSGNIWMGGGAISTPIVVAENDTVIIPRGGVDNPSLDPRPLKEFYTESTEISTATWKPGGAIGLRVRQACVGSQYVGQRWVGPGRRDGSNNPIYGIGIEVRGSRTYIRGTVSGFWNALILNFNSLRNCDIELYLDNCEIGVQFESYAEHLAGAQAWGGINNHIKIWYNNVATPVVNNIADATEFDWGLSTFTPGRRGNVLQVYDANAANVPEWVGVLRASGDAAPNVNYMGEGQLMSFNDSDGSERLYYRNGSELVGLKMASSADLDGNIFVAGIADAEETLTTTPAGLYSVTGYRTYLDASAASVGAKLGDGEYLNQEKLFACVAKDVAYNCNCTIDKHADAGGGLKQFVFSSAGQQVRLQWDGTQWETLQDDTGNIPAHWLDAASDVQTLTATPGGAAECSRFGTTVFAGTATPVNCNVPDGLYDGHRKRFVFDSGVSSLITFYNHVDETASNIQFSLVTPGDVMEFEWKRSKWHTIRDERAGGPAWASAYADTIEERLTATPGGSGACKVWSTTVFVGDASPVNCLLTAGQYEGQKKLFVFESGVRSLITVQTHALGSNKQYYLEIPGAWLEFQWTDGAWHTVDMPSQETLTVTPYGLYAQPWGTTVFAGSGTAVNAKLADGEFEGQAKLFRFESGVSSTITVDTHETSNPEQFLLDADGELCEFEWLNGAWKTIRNTGTVL